MAIQPTLPSDEMLKKAKPLEKFLRQSLGNNADVQVYVSTSYAAVVESLRFGHAHVAFISAWPAQLAIARTMDGLSAWLRKRFLLSAHP